MQRRTHHATRSIDASRQAWYRLLVLAALAASCGVETPPESGTGGAPSTGGSQSSGGVLVSGGKASGGARTGGSPTTGGGGAECGATAGPAPTGFTAIASNGSVGLEWAPVSGATSYNVYWSTSSGVTPNTGQVLTGAARGYVHRGLNNATTYYYVVTAVTASGEGPPSPQVSATPAGEWVLEQLGTGDFSSITGPCPVPTVPIANRVHVLLFPEGYTADKLATFHSDTSHAARTNDVDRWVDEVFAIEPYRLFPQAYVVWFLPRASVNETGGASTAFSVTVSGGSVTATSATAAPAWAAIALHPYPPTVFDDPKRAARTAVAAFLVYDPAQGRAGLSGLTTTLTNPNASTQRISAAFAMGHAHEFTHAMSWLSDEYMETKNPAPASWNGWSNVVGTAQCSQLPWAHLLYGTAINPSTDELVGAFGGVYNGVSLGYHSELLCLLNGTHTNGLVFYDSAYPNSRCTQSSCTLRVNNRMCNFCREMTTFRSFQRVGILSTATAGFDTWVSQYRTPFYSAYGFKVPAPVPQTNDVYRPANGAPIFQPCTP